jgi:hypothetical protein
MSPLTLFLHGALATASAIAGLFFLRFWRVGRDRLFLFFAAAFWVLALDWTVIALVEIDANVRHYFIAPRVVAFALIIVGVLDKNRRGRA